jgi:hypothetical protein
LARWCVCIFIFILRYKEGGLTDPKDVAYLQLGLLGKANFTTLVNLRYLPVVAQLSLKYPWNKEQIGLSHMLEKMNEWSQNSGNAFLSLRRAEHSEL